MLWPASDLPRHCCCWWRRCSRHGSLRPIPLRKTFLHGSSPLRARIGWGLTPALDQEVGGLLMWVAGGFVFLAVMVVLFLQWFGMAETDGVEPAAASF